MDFKSTLLINNIFQYNLMKQIIIFSLVTIGLILIGTMGYLSYLEFEGHEHDDEHDHSVEIEGSEMKSLTVQQIADLWEINAETLRFRIVTEFELEGNHTVNSVLEDIREEYPFSPAMIKDMAEEIKQEGLQDE